MNSVNFNRLLGWLDPDRDRAAERYESIRRRLIAFFHAQGCASATEELADRTLDVVARKVAAGAEIHVKPEHYCYGVARKIRLEHAHLPTAVPLQFDLAVESADAVEEDLSLLGCLVACLQRLSPQERELIRRFYDGQGRARILGRKQMAEEAGISRNALRIRAYGLRRRLERDLLVCSRLRSITLPRQIVENVSPRQVRLVRRLFPQEPTGASGHNAAADGERPL